MKTLRFLFLTLLAALLPAAASAQTTVNYQGTDYILEDNAFYVNQTTDWLWTDSLNSTTNRVTLRIPNTINGKPVKGIRYLKAAVTIDVYLSDNTEYIGPVECSSNTIYVNLYVNSNNVEFKTSSINSSHYTIKYYGDRIKSYTKYSSGYAPTVKARNGTSAYVQFKAALPSTSGFDYFDATITSKGGGIVRLDNMGTTQVIDATGGTIHFKYDSEMSAQFAIYAYVSSCTAFIKMHEGQKCYYMKRDGFIPNEGGMTKYDFHSASISPDEDNTLYEVVFVKDPATVHVENNGIGTVEIGTLTSDFITSTTTVTPESTADLSSYVLDITSSKKNLTAKVTYDKSAYTCKVTYSGAAGSRELELDTTYSTSDWADMDVLEEDECTITITYYPIGSDVPVPTGYIAFADDQAKQICIDSWADGASALSYAKAQAVTSLRKDDGLAFHSQSSITSFDELQFFTGLTTLDDYSFMDCTNMKSVTLPRTLKTIGTMAFGGCEALAQIYLHEGLETINVFPFIGSGLQTLFIPKTVSNIVAAITAGATQLTSISIDAANPHYDSREGCDAIIRTSDNALVAGCQTTRIPKTVTTISSGAFYGQTQLTAIEIPAAVTKIDESAFFFCTNLTSVVVRATTPPEISLGDAPSFGNISSNCVLTVPKGTRQAYIDAGWTEEVFQGGIVESADAATGCDGDGDGRVSVTDVTKVVNAILDEE